MDTAAVTTWQFAPGRNADHWDEFFADRIIAISFGANIGDLRQYRNREELAGRLGLDEAKNSNDLLNLEYFRDAAIGDIVVARRGRRTVIGIGVIEGPYEYHANRNQFWHVRKARWLVSTELQFDESIFRIDTFFRTLKWQKIKDKLLERHPGLREELERIEFRHTESHQQISPGQLRGLRETLSRAIQRKWVKSITGLLPAMEAALKAAGGPVKVDDVPDNETRRIAIASRRGLRKSCSDARGKVDSSDPVLPHVDAILLLTERPPTTSDEPNQQDVYTREQALRESGLDESIFEEYWELLQHRRQVVFQGPPGTGKTYLAEIYGRLVVAGDMHRLEVVQFHPSYSYEDFVEGYRPTTGGGLEVREGIFKLICGKARKSDDATVLIIDEINRGDLSKIFGELLPK